VHEQVEQKQRGWNEVDGAVAAVIFSSPSLSALLQL